MENNNQPSRHEWPEPKEYRKSIRVEFSVYVSIIIIFLMALTGYVITGRYVSSVTDAVIEKLLVQARAYSSQAGKHILSNENPDALLLTNICAKLTNENSDIYWAGITDHDNIFIAHSDIKQVISGKELDRVSSGKFQNSLLENECLALIDDTIYVSVPITENGVALGNLGIGSSTYQIVAARNTSIITVVTITLIMILFGLPFTMFLLHRKLRPLGIITGNLQKVSMDNPDINIPIENRNEFGYLAATLRVMGTRLSMAQKELVEKERFARELEIAREIQTNILPQGYPSTSRFEFAGSYRSAREVGGDYYDFIDFGNDRTGFLVADVSGKSLPGMLVMLLTRDIVKKHAARLDSPAELLKKVNKDLLPNIKKGMFVTMFMGVVDNTTGQFKFASAGHNPLIHIPADSGVPKLIKTKGFPLGMMKPEQFDPRMEEGDFTLASNDWLVQYTDGINEAKNKENNEYGMDRFIGTVSAFVEKPPNELVAGVLARHSEFVATAPQFDDITLLVMKWYGQENSQKTYKNNEAMYADQYQQ